MGCMLKPLVWACSSLTTTSARLSLRLAACRVPPSWRRATLSRMKSDSLRESNIFCGLANIMFREICAEHYRHVCIIHRYNRSLWLTPRHSAARAIDCSGELDNVLGTYCHVVVSSMYVWLNKLVDNDNILYTASVAASPG